mgnify:CR=1 FL=1
MPNRYIVHGEENGQRVRKVFEAGSAKEAAQEAENIGVKVLGVEVDDPLVGPVLGAGVGAGLASGGLHAARSGEALAKSPLSAGAPPVHDEPERTVWEGTPSQWTNFWWFAGAVVALAVSVALVWVLRSQTQVGPLAWLALAIGVAGAGLAAWYAVMVRTTRYRLTTQRLRMEWGVVAKAVEEVELYRVTDSAVRQSVVERVLRIGTVWLETSDQRNKEVLLRSVPDPRGLREQIRQLSEARRRWRRVSEIEVS